MEAAEQQALDRVDWICLIHRNKELLCALLQWPAWRTVRCSQQLGGDSLLETFLGKIK